MSGIGKEARTQFEIVHPGKLNQQSVPQQVLNFNQKSRPNQQPNSQTQQEAQNAQELTYLEQVLYGLGAPQMLDEVRQDVWQAGQVYIAKGDNPYHPYTSEQSIPFARAELRYKFPRPDKWFYFQTQKGTLTGFGDTAYPRQGHQFHKLGKGTLSLSITVSNRNGHEFISVDRKQQDFYDVSHDVVYPDYYAYEENVGEFNLNRQDPAQSQERLRQILIAYSVDAFEKEAMGEAVLPSGVEQTGRRMVKEVMPIIGRLRYGF